MSARTVLCGALLLAAAGGSLAQDVTVTATASKKDVTVGEPFLVEVSAQGPAGTAWTFPAEVNDDTVEMHARPQARPVPGAQSYEAMLFAIADASVPAITVSYQLPDGTRGEAKSAPIPMTVTSLLPRDPKERQLADVREPVPIGIGRAFWVALGTLLAVLALAAYWLWRRRRARVAPPLPVVPLTPPDVEAVAALDRLSASGLLDREEYRPFYIALAEIAKRYLERRLDAPVLEMTTAEMLAFLRGHRHGTDMVGLMRDLSGAADLVKFARGQGAQDGAQHHLESVRRLVAEVERRLQPVPVPPPPGAASSVRGS